MQKKTSVKHIRYRLIGGCVKKRSWGRHLRQKRPPTALPPAVRLAAIAAAGWMRTNERSHQRTNKPTNQQTNTTITTPPSGGNKNSQV